MRLLPLPDASGTPQLWINADHLVSVMLVTRGSEHGVKADVEVKVDGMPLHRIPLGEYVDVASADVAFTEFRRVIEDAR